MQTDGTTEPLRRRVARTRLAPVAAFPVRAATVARYDARVLQRSGRWLFGSQETTNFTYDLTPLNREHLAWWVVGASGATIGQVRGWFAELEQDDELRAHVENGMADSRRSGLADREARYGRRMGWYALIRAFRPAHVVETGTDKGLGSCVLAAALLRNGSGRLTTLDVNPEAGYLISGRYASVTSIRIGDSLAALDALEQPVDLFLHDSLHSAAHERSELERVTPHLTDAAVVMSDNAHVTDVLPRWAEETGRTFTFFDERPADHWYPGAGIGLAHR